MQEASDVKSILSLILNTKSEMLHFSLVVEIWMFFRTPSAAALILLISTLSMSSEANASSEMRKVIVRLMDIIDYVYPGFMEYTCLQHSSLVLITCRVFFLSVSYKVSCDMHTYYTYFANF